MQATRAEYGAALLVKPGPSTALPVSPDAPVAPATFPPRGSQAEVLLAQINSKQSGKPSASAIRLDDSLDVVITAVDRSGPRFFFGKHIYQSGNPKRHTTRYT